MGSSSFCATALAALAALAVGVASGGASWGCRAPEAAVGSAVSAGALPKATREDGEPVVSELEVEGAWPAQVWAPRGSAAVQVWMVAHGAGCVAEDHCAYYWRVLRGRALVVCLRGRPLFRARPEDGFFYSDHLSLEREVLAAARALERQFGSHLTPGWTYAGYSQGATMGALMAPEHGELFTRLLLIEGGSDGWTRARALQFGQAFGARVLFVCGGSLCERRARQAVVTLSASGLAARVAVAPGAGHTYLGAVEEALGRELDWFWSGGDSAK